MTKSARAQHVWTQRSASTSRASGRHRQPYAWLGAGALTLGVGMALAGAGAAHADDASTASSSTSARPHGSASAGKSARHAGSPTTPTIAAAKVKPTATAASVARSRVRTIPATPAVAYVTHPRKPLDPNDFGPVLGTIVRLANEIQYVITDQKPIVKPFQLPSAPNQSVVVGTLGAYSTTGNPVAVTVTTAPTNGTVAIAPNGGYYVYTANSTTGAAGATDSFTITATDTGYHPLADLLHLFGVGQHSTTVTVPVNVIEATQPPGEADTTQYTVFNTSYQSLQIGGYGINQGSLSPAVGWVIQSPATATDSSQTQALFEIADGKTVTVYLNPVGVVHEGVTQNFGVQTPTALALSPDGTYLYTVDVYGKVVATNTSSGLTTASTSVPGAWNLAITPDGSRLYVTQSTGASVSVIDTATGAVTASIAVGTNQQGIAVSPDGKYAYTANGDANTISVISIDPTDPNYNTVTATIGGVGQVETLTVSPDSARVYALDFNTSTMRVIDTATNTVTASVGVSNPSDVAVSPDGTRIYVVDEGTLPYYNNGSVTVLNSTTFAVEATIAVDDPGHLALSADGTQLYVTTSDSVAIVDTDPASTHYNTVVNSVRTGDITVDVVAGPSNTTFYASNYLSNSVSQVSVAPAGVTGDGGSWGYVITMTGGSAPTCSAGSSRDCAAAGTSTYAEDAPGTVYHIPSDQAQEQSDVLQNLVDDDLSNAVFSTKSTPTIGYTNPLKAQGFSPYTNNTSSASTSAYATTTTTSTADSTTFNLAVKVAEEYKMGNLTLKAEESASLTWGVTTTNTMTYTQTLTQTVQPGETLYLYTETPVYRFYGDWTVTYGNTTYVLENVWYDTPYPASSLYPSYVAAYTCNTGSTQCSQLASGDLSGYPDAFPTAAPTYPVAESDPDSSYSSGATGKATAERSARMV